jgi:hypothetical protein
VGVYKTIATNCIRLKVNGIGLQHAALTSFFCSFGLIIIERFMCFLNDVLGNHNEFIELEIEE